MESIPVLFSDESIIVINKPAGILSLPDRYNETAPHVKGILEPSFGKLWLVHRLDKDTSGTLILARNEASHRVINMQFEKHEVFKIYHAIITGKPSWKNKTALFPLSVNAGRRHRTIVDFKAGKNSATHFKVIEHLGDYTLVEAIPKTGRTHQIRAHLLALGHPILCDELYYTDKKETNSKILKRTGLHAFSITIKHPVSKENFRVEAPYPEDMELALNYFISQKHVHS
ncbi:MAG: RluA family pseudouridine synthase [Desulfobacterales bacterium]|nr:RluA family pseudouridine synthase [Desulfobacterales bacterium]